MINNPCSTSRQGLALATNLTLVQHNSLGSWDVFLSLFSSLVEGPPPDLVLLQDPPSSKGFPLVSQASSLLPLPLAGPEWPATYLKTSCQDSRYYLSFPP